MQTNTVLATITDKRNGKYFPYPGKNPIPNDLFEVTFTFEDGQTKTFEVDYITYHHLEVEDQGPLTYDENNIIRFIDKIQPFSMDDEHSQ